MASEFFGKLNTVVVAVDVVEVEAYPDLQPTTAHLLTISLDEEVDHGLALTRYIRHRANFQQKI